MPDLSHYLFMAQDATLLPVSLSVLLVGVADFLSRSLLSLLTRAHASFHIFQTKEDTLIQVEDYQAHVVCNADRGDDREHTRRKIRDALISCLNKF